jgi:hypothetical protein
MFKSTRHFVNTVLSTGSSPLKEGSQPHIEIGTFIACFQVRAAVQCPAQGFRVDFVQYAHRGFSRFLARSCPRMALFDPKVRDVLLLSFSARSDDRFSIKANQLVQSGHSIGTSAPNEPIRESDFILT